MKTLVLLMAQAVFLTCVLAAITQASEIKIGQLPDYSDIKVDQINYQVNAPLGRARLDVVFTSQYFGSDDDHSPYSEDQYLVEGLSYSNSQVIFKDGSAPAVVCAELATKNTIFGHKTYYKPTGACTISLKKESVVNDDGFNQSTETDTAVVFQTK